MTKTCLYETTAQGKYLHEKIFIMENIFAHIKNTCQWLQRVTFGWFNYNFSGA